DRRGRQPARWNGRRHPARGWRGAGAAGRRRQARHPGRPWSGAGWADRTGRAGGRTARIRPDQHGRLPAVRLATLADADMSSAPPDGAIRVLIADDDPLLRAGLRMMLASAADVDVVAEAGDGTQVLPLVDRHAPDVVLMDIRMPVMDGLAATEAV